MSAYSIADLDDICARARVRPQRVTCRDAGAAQRLRRALWRRARGKGLRISTKGALVRVEVADPILRVEDDWAPRVGDV